MLEDFLKYWKKLLMLEYITEQEVDILKYELSSVNIQNQVMRYANVEIDLKLKVAFLEKIKQAKKNSTQFLHYFVREFNKQDIDIFVRKFIKEQSIEKISQELEIDLEQLETIISNIEQTYNKIIID